MGDKVMKQIFIFSDSQKDNISYFEREPAMLVSMNRSDLPYLKEQDFASHTAIYVLIGGNKRYVGQAAGQTIYQRLYQHFSIEDKKWVESVLFFSRTDGKLSKADTDYLEKQLIQDFTEKSDYQMMNSTIGNKSYIGKLSKAQSDQLYETVFEIIDDIANIDLFGVSEGELTNEVSPSDMFEIQYDGHTLQSKSARGLFVDFVKSILVDDKYKQQIEELIAPNAPTAGVVLGRKVSTYNGRPISAEVAPGVWLFTNFSRKDTKNKLEKLTKQLGISAKINWK